MVNCITKEDLQQQVNDIIIIEDDSKVLQIANSITDLMYQLSNMEDAWTLCHDLAKFLGNCARNPSVRIPLGEAGIIEATTALLKKIPHPIEFDIQALRILGNLSIDRDENRKRVLDSGVIDTVMALFGGNDNMLNMMLGGFCINTAMDYEPMKLAIIEKGGVQALCDIVGNLDLGNTQAMALKALDNLMDQESARAAFTSNPIYLDNMLTLLTRIWKSDPDMDLEHGGHLADIILQVIMDDDQAQIRVFNSGAIPDLISFLETNLTIETKLDLDEEDKEELDKVMDLKQAISKIVVYATSPDALIGEIYQDSSFMTNLMNMIASNSELPQMTAVNIIGNLARTDGNCLDLVQTHHLETLLVNLYKQTENAIFQCTILGCLKHICVPIGNRTVIGEAGVIELVAPLLDPSKDMVKRNQFLAIVILKLLCTNHFSNTKRLLEGTGQDKPTILDDLIAFLDRVDDIAAKSETTRVFTQLVKSVWSQPDQYDLRQRLLQKPILNAIIELIRTSKFPVLKNDGIIALTVMLADHDSTLSKDMLADTLPLIAASHPIPVEPNEEDKENVAPSEEETRSFLAVIVDDISETELPIEIQCNACILLENAIKVSLAVNNNDVYDTLKKQCSPLSYVSNPTLVRFIQKINLVLEQVQ
ncbi:armadillo-type protein [Halteromyces radiatus]|uniref:armadillo-type protein n=1 Tax=Halteromyces radiatus TaxID=101107 RepID=UPI00221EBA8A|nr:armadillo-type protein [Halteromyces radiatus]KAI8098575.1 armadillo-type protein [Halteromyces radiatus]